MGAGWLEPSAGEGEERLTIGRKARPPRVFTMAEPEKGRKWREREGGGGGGGFRNWKRGCEMIRKERKGVLYKEEGGGGGGGGRQNERSWPINGLKCLFNGWFEKEKEN